LKYLLGALVAIACIAVTSASGYYLISDRQKIAHEAECKDHASKARTAGSMVDDGYEWARENMRDHVDKYVKAGCDLKELGS
jgi:hypothetical protein